MHRLKGSYVHLRKGINEHMWGFIKTVNNKLLTVVWAKNIMKSIAKSIMKIYVINKIIVKFIYLLYYI